MGAFCEYDVRPIFILLNAKREKKLMEGNIIFVDEGIW